ncbi:UBB protein, partial [Atractosteus spatula]|nr:UBB protein [Atractosteus spatula]
MQITVRLLTGKVCSVDLEPSATVTELKQEVKRLAGIPETSQKLAVNGDGHITVLEDHRTLSDYDLSPASSVMMLVTEPKPTPSKIFLSTHNGQTRTYTFHPDEGVSDFCDRVTRQEGVPRSQQRLIYNGKQLDENKRMSHYGITPQSTVHQTLRLRGGGWAWPPTH